MSTGTKLIKDLISKLGLPEENLLKKALEYLRLIEIKINSGYAKNLNIDEMCKAVVCVDLAATQSGNICEKDELLKFSGMKNRVYSNYRNMIEKLLGISETFDIRKICLQLGITEISNFAENILELGQESEKGNGLPEIGDRIGGWGSRPEILQHRISNFRYKSSQKHLDTENPMYFAAAISLACKWQNIKIEKSSLVKISLLKPKGFKELMENFEKHVDRSKVSVSLPKVTESIAAAVENKAKECEIIRKQVKAPDGDILQESYSDWKRRMLEGYETVNSL